MPPGIPPAGPAGSGRETIAASVVIIKLEIEAASTRAVLTTLVGSIIPAYFMLTYLSL
jgi:hypothetical protein